MARRRKFQTNVIDIETREPLSQEQIQAVFFEKGKGPPPPDSASVGVLKSALAAAEAGEIYGVCVIGFKPRPDAMPDPAPFISTGFMEMPKVIVFGMLEAIRAMVIEQMILSSIDESEDP